MKHQRRNSRFSCQVMHSQDWDSSSHNLVCNKENFTTTLKMNFGNIKLPQVSSRLKNFHIKSTTVDKSSRSRYEKSNLIIVKAFDLRWLRGWRGVVTWNCWNNFLKLVFILREIAATDTSWQLRETKFTNLRFDAYGFKRRYLRTVPRGLWLFPAICIYESCSKSYSISAARHSTPLNAI